MNISSETSPLLPFSASSPNSPSWYFNMSRSSTFQSAARQALTKHPSAKLNENEVRGPISWLNPTRALFDLQPKDKTATTDGVASTTEDPVLSNLPHDAKVQWRSRDNRKGNASCS